MVKSRKIMYRFFSFLLAAVMVCASIPVSADAAKKPKLNKTSATIRVGKKVTLKVKNSKKKVKWKIQSGKKFISLKKKKKSSVVVQGKKPGNAKVVARIGKKKLVCKVKVKPKKTDASAEDNDPVGGNGTQTPTGTTEPTKVPDQTAKPGPAVTPKPEPSTEPTPPVPEVPGQNVDLPGGFTVFTLGSKKLSLGMPEADVYKVLGSSASQEIRMGKAPQGFDTIAYNNSDYSEYLLIYLKDGLVVGICGMGRSMAFSDAVAGTNGNNLSASWNNSSDYKTASGKIGAKKATISAGETAYAFYDALGDNTIYCIQVYNPSSVKQWEDMIYGTTGNLSYNTTVTDSIAVEIGKMFNAFRSYRTVPLYQLNDGLAKCAQDYCNTADGNKIDPRNADDLLNILLGYGVDPMQWGEACYYDAADAISFTNSLIQLDNLYPELVGANASTWMHMGVGVAANSKHTYLTIDYVNEI